MNNIDKMNDIPSTASLAKLGTTAIGYTAGGIFLFLLQVFSRFRGLGIIIGAVVLIVGLVFFSSKDPADKKAGAVIMIAGVLALLSKVPIVAPLAGTLMFIGALGLLALGILNGVKFFIGLKKRS